jgi:uncharacterized protein YfaS (alpha-2-macroglobulin family)
MFHRGWLYTVVMLGLWFGGLLPLTTGPNVRAHASGSLAPSTDDSNKGLQFRLSEGAEQPQGRAFTRAVYGEPLTESDAQALLGRLKPIKAEPGDEEEFSFRDRSLPPPLTGKTISDSFPAKTRNYVSDQPAAGPLDVVRYAPEGDVPIAPHLSVTFSQPMVSRTSLDFLSAQPVPVRLSPQPSGHWRWANLDTILFEPDHRFPMATTYSIEVPAGVNSASGQTLKSARRWSFTTPAPQIKASYPTGGPRRRDQIMFIEFDQRVEPAQAMEKIHVRVTGSELRTRLASPREVDSDKEIKELVKSAPEGRWLAFRAVSDGLDDARLALPADSTVTVTIDAGMPSAEGPLVTTAGQSFSFATYGPLRVDRYECQNKDCRPRGPWTIQFTNPLDAEGFSESQVRVEPELAGMKVGTFGRRMQISGQSRPHTSYQVTLDPSIKDLFGQTLGNSAVASFDVQAGEPRLMASRPHFAILDPYGPPHYSVYSTNHSELRVSLYAVGPEDWSKYLDFKRSWLRNGDSGKSVKFGRLVLSNVVPVAGQPDEIAETPIDLSPALKSGLGQVVMIVEPTGVPAAKKQGRSMPLVVWVQITGIGLDAFVDNSDMVAWATWLKDGRPIQNARISLQSTAARSATGSDGIARLGLPAHRGSSQSLLVARAGADVAILPNLPAWRADGAGWFKTPVIDSLRWYVFDDRGIYKPGEEVHIKGWVRRVEGGKAGDVGLWSGAARRISYVVRDSQGNEVARGILTPDALGGFDTKFKLPSGMNLGEAAIEFKAQESRSLDDNTHTHSFEVEEFRRPEFEVSASVSEGPHIIGTHSDVVVKAAYYSGASLPNTEVNWNVTATPGYFTPPNRGDFSFGDWVPWWNDHQDWEQPRTGTFKGFTDSAGRHDLRIDFDSVNPARPMSIRAEASVVDANRQTWTASANLLVHPADLYVGLRSARTFVQPGEPLIIQTIVTDLAGNAITGRQVKLRAVRLEWKYRDGEWRQEEKDPSERSLISTDEPAECRFEQTVGGTYRITATVVDDKTRENRSALTVWVAGEKPPPNRDVTQEGVPLIPDRKDYRPGDTAEILVQAPFFPAEGVLTIRRSGLVSVEHFTMAGPSYPLKVPIKEEYVPNLEIAVDLNGATDSAQDGDGTSPADDDKALPMRPAFASGSLNLLVPPLARKLSVKVSPRQATLEPGAETVVDVQVQDASGTPSAGGEIALIVVDEAVLALSDYKIEDPSAIFYSLRQDGTNDYHSRRQLLLTSGGNGTGMSAGLLSPNSFTITRQPYAGDWPLPPPPCPPPPPPLPRGAPANMSRSAVGSAAVITSEGGRNRQFDHILQTNWIYMRDNFNALAIFASTVPTGIDGRAAVKVKLPDNLTRYRIMAVAVVGEKQFGYGESAITARQPLMVRPSAPRFLNFGDRFDLPILVQNQTDSPMEVKLAVRATNAELTGAYGLNVTVPANDRLEVRIPAAAARPGTARFQIAATSGWREDAAEIEIPVWAAATTEDFAAYGEIDDGAIAQPVEAPANAVPQFGGLELTTSSTQLQSLTDAVLYLTSYPYECSEQLSSRVMAIAALRDVLTAFEAKGLPTPKEMTASVARDIARLQAMQNPNGGFGFWGPDDEPWPYLSFT